MKNDDFKFEKKLELYTHAFFEFFLDLCLNAKINYINVVNFNFFKYALYSFCTKIKLKILKKILIIEI